MDKTQFGRYKAMLMAKRAELSRRPHNLEDIFIEKAPDSLDEVQLAGEREFAICNFNREYGLLRQVDIALMRLADGAYGVCLHCEGEISPKRLDAVPWTAHCLKCQEAADREVLERGEFADKWLANAA